MYHCVRQRRPLGVVQLAVASVVERIVMLDVRMVHGFLVREHVALHVIVIVISASGL